MKTRQQAQPIRARERVVTGGAGISQSNSANRYSLERHHEYRLQEATQLRGTSLHRRLLQIFIGLCAVGVVVLGALWAFNNSKSRIRSTQPSMRYLQVPLEIATTLEQTREVVRISFILDISFSNAVSALDAANQRRVKSLGQSSLRTDGRLSKLWKTGFASRKMTVEEQVLRYLEQRRTHWADMALQVISMSSRHEVMTDEFKMRLKFMLNHEDTEKDFLIERIMLKSFQLL